MTPDQRDMGPPPRRGRARVSGAGRALFLSGSLGNGHDALAAACAAVLGDLGVESRTVDCLGLMGRRSGRVGSWAFARLVGSPLYDAFHFGELHGEGRLGRWADRSAVSRMYPRLLDEVESYRPDVVLPVFATGVGAACRLKREGRCRQVIVFLPDAVAHRIWVHREVDLFLVTSLLGAASVRRYWPEAPIRIVDRPVTAEFASPPTGQAARAALGVPADAECVLLMAGGWGLGPLDAIAASLAAAGYWVLAVAGTNIPLLRRLRSVAERFPTVIAMGYSHRVPELMAASDIVVTTSGATCWEARAMGRGLLLLDVVPGHGRENLLHQLEMGHAAVAPATPEGVTRAARTYLAHPDLWAPSGPSRRRGSETFATALADLGVFDSADLPRGRRGGRWGWARRDGRVSAPWT